MNVVDKELYLGAALAQIVESPGFESIRKAGPLVGHYCVNERHDVLIRHTKSERGPWYFTFRPRDVRAVRTGLDATCAEPGRSFSVGLVCGNAVTCLLTAPQLVQVLDLGVEEPQSLRVYTRPGAQLAVSGSAGTLKGKVTTNAFPSGLFRGTRRPNGAS